MKIERHISSNKNHFKGKNSCKYITIHQTGNTKKGANALNHARYINNGSKATWHYTVDSERIVQHFEDTVQCFHAGDGSGTGNKHSIGIEMCVNSDGDYIKAIENMIELIKHLMTKHNIPISNVVQHNRWSGKDCPQQIRNGLHGITWGFILERVTSNVGMVKQGASEPNIRTVALEVIAGKHGNGEQRKKKLGSMYHAVQKEVNRILTSK